jgi:signal transduction histidine kinase
VLADVHRLNAVLDDLLVAADPARQTPLTVVPLAEVVDGAVQSAQAHASAVQVTLTCAVHPAGRGETSEVLGAEAALRRAVLALVDNAIDHTPPAGVVTVTVRPGRRQVVLRVSDTGPGLDATSARDVLRRFHSGSQRAGRNHYGLGLALTHDIVNRFGGRLRLLDDTGGATFEAVLPAAPSST